MKKTLFAILTVLFLLPAMSAQAYDYDYSGHMQYHNDVLQFNFSVSTSGTRTFFSSSWDDGGFDPMLGLWSSTGNLINFQDDGDQEGTEYSNGVGYDYGEWDSYYAVALAAGDYILTLSTYNNFSAGTSLSDGFNLDNETPILIGDWNQPPSANGYRTDYYEFHILNVDSAVGPGPSTVPEPSAFILLGAGLCGLIAFGRKRFARK